MQINRRCALYILAAAVIDFQLPRRLSARDDSAPSADEARRALVRKYVAANRAKDAIKARELLHPKVLECVKDSNREYFDYLVKEGFAEVPRGTYKLKITRMMPEAVPPAMPAGMFQYPLEPTYQFEIEWHRRENDSISVIRTIAASGPDWFVVYPCPNAQGMKIFHDGLAQGKKQQERYQALAAALPDTLRVELKDLLKQGRKLDAAKKYQTILGTDLATGVQVVNALESSSN